MSTPRLQLLPLSSYTGVNRNDPVRFYFWPVLGRLYRRRVELCLAELSGGERVLEIGFGSGLTFLNLRDRYREIHGLDLTADVAKVSELWRGQGLETHLRNGDALSLPYEGNTFDSVLLISILEHLKPVDQRRAFSEIARVLKPGGQVVYGVPIERPLMVFMFRVLGYNIREHHFSTEQDVRAAADSVLTKVHVRQMTGAGGLAGAVYEVGHFAKPATPSAVS